MTTGAPRAGRPRHVLVIGAYGLIGSGIARRLLSDGCRVSGLGRNSTTARRVLPGAEWHHRDLATLRDTSDWADLLFDVDIVVNCAGALQDGAADRLDIVHRQAVATLAAACRATATGLVQISAVGARTDAGTAFLRTKAAGDDAVRSMAGDWWIIRPGLVLAPTAYGGTALLRMLAAVPLVQPLALPDARIQTVGLADLAEVAARIVRGDIPPGLDCDLAAAQPTSLRDLVSEIRCWLGFAPARWEVVAPDRLTAMVGRIADTLGRFGWRSPLRTTTLDVLRDGVVTQAPVEPKTGPGPGPLPTPNSLASTLQAIPAGAEDRLAARMALLMPIVVATLALFWLISGLVGLMALDQAARILVEAGWPGLLAKASVVLWSLVDILLAVLVAMRRTARVACWAMVGVGAFYLVASTLLVPHLWADPLGPLVKVVPALVLAVVARVLLEPR